MVAVLDSGPVSCLIPLRSMPSSTIPVTVPGPLHHPDPAGYCNVYEYEC